MACYRNGGCGPYENRSCNECPASKPEYLNRDKAAVSSGNIPVKEPIKIKAFLNEDGVMCVLTDAGVPVEIEFIDAVAIESEIQDRGEAIAEENDPVDAYVNQLCADGFMYVPDANIRVTNMLYESE